MKARGWPFGLFRHPALSILTGMKVFLLTLLAALLAGCASPGGPRLEPFGARFDPTLDIQGSALRMENQTGQDLHEVKLSIYIVSNTGQSILHHYGEIALWRSAQEIILKESMSNRLIVFPRWCRDVRLRGTCAEGKIRETFRVKY